VFIVGMGRVGRTVADALADAAIGYVVIERGVPRGLDLATTVLRELGLDDDAVAAWMRRQQERALAGGAAKAA
jgi:Trk K+ transport system NAD-binding subunit